MESGLDLQQLATKEWVRSGYIKKASMKRYVGAKHVSDGVYLAWLSWCLATGSFTAIDAFSWVSGDVFSRAIVRFQQGIFRCHLAHRYLQIGWTNLSFLICNSVSPATKQQHNNNPSSVLVNLAISAVPLRRGSPVTKLPLLMALARPFYAERLETIAHSTSRICVRLIISLDRF